MNETRLQSRCRGCANLVRHGWARMAGARVAHDPRAPNPMLN
jgi:hypothetical protein